MTKKSVKFEIKKNLDKFDEITSTEESSRSDRSSTRKTFKTLVNDNYNQYLSKITKPYSYYKSNHSEIKNKKQNIISFDSLADDNESKLDTISQMNDEFLLSYGGTEKAVKTIPQEFLVDTNVFKIRSEFMNYNFDKLHSICDELCDISSFAEDELSKVTKYSSHLVNYITDNLEYEKDFEEYIQKIKVFK